MSYGKPYQGQDSSLSLSLSRTKRVDVTESCSFQFVTDIMYSARFGFAINATGRCAMILDDKHISPKTAQALRTLKEFYLQEDIRYLALDLEKVQLYQLVVAVDTREELVMRGVFYGKSGQECLIMCPDLGSMVTVPSDKLYATTELAAKTEFTGFFCELYLMDLFFGSCLVPQVFETAIKVYGLPPLSIKHGTVFDIECLGFTRGSNDNHRIPIVALYPRRDGVRFETSYNEEMVVRCVAAWRLLLGPKKVGESFRGSVAHVNDTGRLHIHLVGEEDVDTPAFYMEKFLRQFDLASLQKKCPRLTREDAQAGQRQRTIYVAEFDEDKVLYRAILTDVHNAGVVVEFIDYGNSSYVTYDRIFEAKALADILTIVPPLTWQAHLCSIEGPTNQQGAAVLEYFQDTFEAGFMLTFQVRDGNNSGIPLVTISAAKDDGRGYDVILDLLDRGLVTERRLVRRTLAGR